MKLQFYHDPVWREVALSYAQLSDDSSQLNLRRQGQSRKKVDPEEKKEKRAGAATGQGSPKKK